MKRRDFKVNVVDSTRITDTAVIIRWNGFFQLTLNDSLIAGCDSAKRLSDWAFENGAQSVRHEYDLRLSDNEQ